MTGVGLISGPIIGSTLYSILGYANTFFIYGSILILAGLMIKLKFPTGDQKVTNFEDDDFMGSVRTENDDDNFGIQDDLGEFNQDDKLGLILNKLQSGDDATASNQTANQVTTGKLLCTPRFIMAALSSSICYFLCVFMEPILAERVVDFDLSPMQVGLFFAISPIFYIPSSILVCYLPKWIDKRFTIIMATALSGVAFVFAGPS